MKELENLSYGTYNLVFPVKTIPLHAMLSGSGYQCETSPNYRWHGMKRGRQALAIWQYTISGSGMIKYNGQLLPVPSGTAMMLYLPHNHCYFLPDSSSHWEFIYINFNGRELLRIWQELSRLAGPLAQFAPNSPTVQMAIKILRQNATGAITTPLQASALAYQLVMKIADKLLLQQGDKSHTPEAIIQAIDYCLEHLHEPITVDDLANASGYSRFHFSRLFKKHQGTSPANFIRNLRLQHAIRLLQSEIISVKEVADRCGFTNDNYFCKVFRQEFGTSPNLYRNGEKTNKR